MPIQRIRELSAFKPLNSTMDIVLTWASIISAMWISNHFSNPFLTVLVVIWIGSRQHALGTITHDAAHWRLYRNRKLNDFMAELFCAWPLFVRMDAYRFTHLKHHEFVGTENDPEAKKDRYPKSRKEIFFLLLRELSGLNVVNLIKDSRQMDQAAPVTLLTQVLRMTFYAGTVALITYFGAWKLVLLYWMLPIFTWLSMILKFRAIADHAGLEEHSQDGGFPSRTLVPSLFDRLFIAPRNVSYHLCHHLYMTVPSKNLKALHEEMLKQSYYRDNFRITQGFHSLLMEFPLQATQGRKPNAKKIAS